MRLVAALLALALGSCTPPKFRKFDRFYWGTINTDVLWLLIDGELHRCWQHPSGGPVCMPVIYPAVQPAAEALRSPKPAE